MSFSYLKLLIKLQTAQLTAIDRSSWLNRRVDRTTARRFNIEIRVRYRSRPTNIKSAVRLRFVCVGFCLEAIVRTATCQLETFENQVEVNS